MAKTKTEKSNNKITLKVGGSSKNKFFKTFDATEKNAKLLRKNKGKE